MRGLNLSWSARVIHENSEGQYVKIKRSAFQIQKDFGVAMSHFAYPSPHTKISNVNLVYCVNSFVESAVEMNPSIRIKTWQDFQTVFRFGKLIFDFGAIFSKKKVLVKIGCRVYNSVLEIREKGEISLKEYDVYSFTNGLFRKETKGKGVRKLSQLDPFYIRVYDDGTEELVRTSGILIQKKSGIYMP